MRKAVEWDDERDQKLEKSYIRHRETLWTAVAKDLGVPWRAVESRAFDLGKKRLAKR